MRVLLVFAVAIAFIAASPAGPVNPDIDRILMSVVKISGETNDGQTSFCTGVVINTGGHVLTADHCIPDSGKVQVDGKDAHILKRGDWLALVDGGINLGKPPLQIAKVAPKILDRVFSIGNAFDWGMIVVERSVAGYYNFEGHSDLTVNAPLGQGMSGGPIVNERGEVVAINQMATVATGIGCDFNVIRKFLK